MNKVLRAISISVGGAYPGGLIGSMFEKELTGAAIGVLLAGLWVFFKRTDG